MTGRERGERGERGEPAGVRRLAFRVLFVQAVTLLLLWLLQVGFGLGAA